MGHPSGALTLSADDRRVVAGWAADCAEQTLAIFTACAPEDARPRQAIDGARAFVRAELQVGAARSLSAQAHTAAREVADPAAAAAARAAGHAAGVAHMAAHALGAGAYAAKAASLAAPEDLSAAERIIDWAGDHASPEVRKVLQRLPSRTRAPGLLGDLLYELHHRLTHRN
jgi:hypothetical protein